MAALLLLAFCTAFSSCDEVTRGMYDQDKDAPTAPFSLDRFYRGNLHSHSNRTDGDVSPERLIRAYRDRGYHFLAVTDHNLTTPPGAFAALHTPGFIVMSGNEVSDAIPSDRPWFLYDRDIVSIHGNALCVRDPIPGQLQEAGAAEALRALAARIRGTGALLQVNHPNYEGALDLEDLATLQGPYLMEVSNMHFDVRNDGEGLWPGHGMQSTEELWDGLLSAGRRVYGTATDDVHDVVRVPAGHPRRRPFLGWVQVAADSLEENALCGALRTGRFYSSTGVELSRVAYDGSALSVVVARGRATAGEPTIRFIGDGGALRQSARGYEASYALRDGETYVRAVIDGDDGKKAWVQPVFRGAQRSDHD